MFGIGSSLKKVGHVFDDAARFVFDPRTLGKFVSGKSGSVPEAEDVAEAVEVDTSGDLAALRRRRKGGYAGTILGLSYGMGGGIGGGNTKLGQ